MNIIEAVGWMAVGFIPAVLWEYNRLLRSTKRFHNETQRQRTIIEAQERELNQWRREYGTLTNDAVWWQEEIGG